LTTQKIISDPDHAPVVVQHHHNGEGGVFISAPKMVLVLNERELGRLRDFIDQDDDTPTTPAKARWE
jgi:hypothetical protein